MPGDDAHGKGTLSVAAILPLVPGGALSEGEWAAQQEECGLHSRDEGWAVERQPSTGFRGRVCICLSFVEQRL